MINSTRRSEYYQQYCGVYISRYLAQEKRNAAANITISIIITGLILGVLGISHPIFAKTDTEEIQKLKIDKTVYAQSFFENNIRNKYKGSPITFPASGVAHVKKVKYINSKPIKINIVELNTKVNPYLRIKPQIAGDNKLNSKTTVRKIAQKENAIVAINGGFFKPQTGVPLGALMIDGEILTGPIFNRVGLAVFENDEGISFKLSNVDFKMNIKTPNAVFKIDNINQPRMLSTYTLLYSPIWGEYSPTAAKNCWNALILNDKIVKISANPIKIPNNGFVVQAPKKTISLLAKSTKLNVEIKLNDEIKDAVHIIGAGPYLVKNSQIYVDYKYQKLGAISGKNPRSAVGYAKNGTFIIVTVDGREQTSVGMTLFELANLMKELGCENAMNFDGGSSSIMYVKGKIVNKAVNKEGIGISNALIVNEINPYELQLSSIQ